MMGTKSNESVKEYGSRLTLAIKSNYFSGNFLAKELWINFEETQEEGVLDFILQRSKTWSVCYVRITE